MATNLRPATPAAQPVSWCPTTASDVGPDHRCPACQLQGDLRRANQEIEQLRRELARVNAALTRKASEAYDLREQLALANRKLARIAGERDLINEAFDAARETIAKLEAERNQCDDCGESRHSGPCEEPEADSNRTLGLVTAW